MGVKYPDDPLSGDLGKQINARLNQEQLWMGTLRTSWARFYSLTGGIHEHKKPLPTRTTRRVGTAPGCFDRLGNAETAVCTRPSIEPSSTELPLFVATSVGLPPRLLKKRHHPVLFMLRQVSSKSMNFCHHRPSMVESWERSYLRYTHESSDAR